MSKKFSMCHLRTQKIFIFLHSTFCRSNSDGSYRSLISQHNGVVSCSILYEGGCHWRCSRHISRTIILSWIEVFQIIKWPRGASIDTQFALFTAASIAHYLEKAVLRFWTGYLTCLWCIKPVVGNLSFLPWKCLLNAFSNVVVGKICSINVRVVMPTDHSNFVTHCVSSKLISFSQCGETRVKGSWDRGDVVFREEKASDAGWIFQLYLY